MSEAKILLEFLECIAHQYNELSELNIINLEPNVKKIKPKTKIGVNPVGSSISRQTNRSKKRTKSISSKKEELISKIESLENKLNKIKSSKDSERIKQLRRKLRTLKNKLNKI
ncbi:MAG: hypothetical protein PWR30_207 [Candidatus Woesearchaeota archaeon]|nr:hypothetical protein [Candidatus Woesearchaeota archaeon]